MLAGVQALAGAATCCLVHHTSVRICCSKCDLPHTTDVSSLAALTLTNVLLARSTNLFLAYNSALGPTPAKICSPCQQSTTARFSVNFLMQRGKPRWQCAAGWGIVISMHRVHVTDLRGMPP